MIFSFPIQNKFPLPNSKISLVSMITIGLYFVSADVKAMDSEEEISPSIVNNSVPHKVKQDKAEAEKNQSRPELQGISTVRHDQLMESLTETIAKPSIDNFIQNSPVEEDSNTGLTLSKVTEQLRENAQRLDENTRQAREALKRLTQREAKLLLLQQEMRRLKRDCASSSGEENDFSDEDEGSFSENESTSYKEYSNNSSEDERSTESATEDENSLDEDISTEM